MMLESEDRNRKETHKTRKGKPVTSGSSSCLSKSVQGQGLKGPLETPTSGLK